MNRVRILILAGTLLIAGMAQAGSGGIRDGGNGGDVVYCDHPLPGEKQIELLDLFESRVLWERTLALGDVGWDYQRRITYVLDRLKRLDPYRASIYAENASHFLDESEFTADELPDIPDSLHIALPEGCRIRQIVIQRSDLQGNEKRFLVNKPLWDMLDDVNRAALVLHETIYREALSLKQSNSINTRLLNGILTSTSIDAMDIRDYLNLFKKIGFGLVRVFVSDENWFDFPVSEFYLDNSWLADHVDTYFFGQKIYGRVMFEIADHKVYLTNLMTDDDTKDFSWPLDGKADGQRVRFFLVSLDRQMRVLEGVISQTLDRTGDHYSLKCEPGSLLSFNNTYENETCIISIETSVNTVDVQGRRVSIVPPDGKKSVTIYSKSYSSFDGIREAKFFQPEEFSIRSKTLTFSGDFLICDDGTIERGQLQKPGELQVQSSTQFITAAEGYDVQLSQDGYVESAELKKGAVLKNEHGKLQYFPARTRIYMDHGGNVYMSIRGRTE